jgi:prepilin-type processing-associated H-X9-DG protein
LQGIEAHRDWLGKTGNVDAQNQRFNQCIKAAPAEIWVVCDFFRKQGIFPHGRKAGATEGGVNVNFLDGHDGLIVWKAPALHSCHAFVKIGRRGYLITNDNVIPAFCI